MKKINFKKILMLVVACFLMTFTLISCGKTDSFTNTGDTLGGGQEVEEVPVASQNTIAQ